MCDSTEKSLFERSHGCVCNKAVIGFCRERNTIRETQVTKVFAKLLCPTDKRDAEETRAPEQRRVKRTGEVALFRLLAELLECNTDSSLKRVLRLSVNSVCSVTPSRWVSGNSWHLGAQSLNVQGKHVATGFESPSSIY